MKYKVLMHFDFYDFTVCDNIIIYVFSMTYSFYFISGQVRRKEQLEAELSRLEADIDKLERAGTILIHK